MQDGLPIHTKPYLKNDIVFGWLVIFAHRRYVFWVREGVSTNCLFLIEARTLKLAATGCQTESLFY